MFYLQKSYQFEAGHRLPLHKGKCSRSHGHSYRLVLHLKGTQLQSKGSETGMLIDFDSVNRYAKPLIKDYLDHHYLNESLNLEHPTAELIAKWIYNALKPHLTMLYAVELHETSTCSVRYEPK